MISGENIIYFGPEKWEGMWRNRHHLMSRFSKKNKVLYVEPVSYLSQVRTQLKLNPVRWYGFLKRVRTAKTTELKKNLFVYHSERNIPITGRFPFDLVTWKLWFAGFKRTLSTLNITNPILWLSKPNMHHIVGRLDEKLVIYHIVDEYLAYADVLQEMRIRLFATEKKMLLKADLALVVSNALYQSKSVFNKQTYVVPNAVDYDAYASVIGKKGSDPADIKQIPRPTIGYSGLISNRLNIELMANIARTKTDWSLVLIGSVDYRGCKSKIETLFQLPNVYYLGIKQISEVPRYIHAFDVCILPYRENDETKSLSALKLYDYMATGNPIVTTYFPEALNFKNIIYICKSEKDFIQYLHKALEESKGPLTAKRKEIAAGNDWDVRVEQISDLIQTTVAKKST